jgi:uncharacterized protein YacL
VDVLAGDRILVRRQRGQGLGRRVLDGTVAVVDDARALAGAAAQVVLPLALDAGLADRSPGR